jgi:hypothetical protein
VTINHVVLQYTESIPRCQKLAGSAFESGRNSGQEAFHYVVAIELLPRKKALIGCHPSRCGKSVIDKNWLDKNQISLYIFINAFITHRRLLS